MRNSAISKNVSSGRDL